MRTVPLGRRWQWWQGWQRYYGANSPHPPCDGPKTSGPAWEGQEQLTNCGLANRNRTEARQSGPLRGSALCDGKSQRLFSVSAAPCAVDQPSGLCPQGRAVLGLSLLLSSSPRMEGSGGTKTRVVVGVKQTPLQKIGSGCFWDTYVAVGISDGEEVAMKLNLRRPGIPGCAARADPLSLQAGVGIPHTWRCGQETELSVLVVDLLGPSLEDLFSFCYRSFTVTTVLRLAEQMISRVEYMHTESCTHRDINQITS